MRRLLASMMAIMMLISLVACAEGGEPVEEPVVDDREVIDITLWCPEELVELTTSQLERFSEKDAKYRLNLSIEAVAENAVADKILENPVSCADVFCFSQDELTRLIAMKTLETVSIVHNYDVTDNNDPGSISAARFEGELFAFPMTTDSGYIAYYDNTVLNETNILNQTAIIEACQNAGRTIAMINGKLGENMIDGGYFIGMGCATEWLANDIGRFEWYDDTFNSSVGMIACKGMAELVNSGVMVESDSVADAFSSGSAVVVADVSDYESAAGAMGNKLGCSRLWRFTVDGKEHPVGSFTRNKLIGVKPHPDSEKAKYCQSIAAYLTGAECQEERFSALSVLPSNINVQCSDACMSNPALAAFSKQSNFTLTMGGRPNSWWGAANEISESIAKLRSADPADSKLQAILNKYSKNIEKVLDEVFTAGWVIAGDLDIYWDYTGHDERGDGSSKYILRDSDGPIWERDIIVPKQAYSGTCFRICRINEWTGGKYHKSGIGYSFLTEDTTAQINGTDDENNVYIDHGTYHIKLDISGDEPKLTVTPVQ